jgi:hypothetical protein
LQPNRIENAKEKQNFKKQKEEEEEEEILE